MYFHVYTHGRGICLEHRVLWVPVPPEAAHFSLKMTVLGEPHCIVLYCLGKSLGLNVHVHVCILGSTG